MNQHPKHLHPANAGEAAAPLEDADLLTQLLGDRP